MKLTRTERGWGAHHILGSRCRFRRNTLLEFDDIKIVVSTVGLAENLARKDQAVTPEELFDPVAGLGSYFETMAFHALSEDNRYHDIDVCRSVSFESPCHIAEIDADDKANDMHERVVTELGTRLVQGMRL
ncbi:hypothetical protein LCGC14_0509960 [marine sediment metagenome]|uniref:Uncharacterized protein n=1 Tax=marine sediment metagenome TaxID=412755 RepID=A0A0F9S1G1_9ZZZZ